MTKLLDIWTMELGQFSILLLIIKYAARKRTELFFLFAFVKHARFNCRVA